jgi:hypothetical protein
LRYIILCVYCINLNGEPLNSIHPAEARKLLKTGDWHVIMTVPFTIKENCIENCSQIGAEPITIGIKFNNSVTMIVSLLKQISTYRIWRLSDKITNFLSKHFWKEKTFWSDGYFACSIGSASIDTIEKYIRIQG